jgi:flagellar biosynthesis/type III secretory pathway M-ring protein FliF/YscJ
MDCGTIYVNYNDFEDMAAIVAALTEKGIQHSVVKDGNNWKITTNK